MSTRKPGNFRGNIVTSYALRGLRAASVLVLTPLLFRRLGVDGFGTWSVLFVVATVFSLGETGATQGVTKYVSELGGRPEEQERLRDLLRAAMRFMLALGVLALAGSVVLGLAVGRLAAPGMETAFATGLVIVGAAMLLRFPGAVCGATLMGLQRYDRFNLAEAVTVGGFMAGAIAVLELGGGIAALAAAYAASMVAGALAFAWMLHGIAPALVVAPRRVGRDAQTAVIGFGRITLLVDAMDFIAMRMDAILVAAIRGAAAASPIGAATRLVGGVQALILPFVGLLLPMIAELEAAGRREAVRRRLLLSTRVAVQVTTIAAGGIALFADDVVSTWLGPSAPPVTSTVVILLMAVQVLILAATPASKLLLALGRLTALKRLAIAEGVGNLAFTLVLVSRIGVVGAALGTLISSGILVPARIPLACRAAACPLGRMLREALLPAARGILAAGAVMLAVRLALDPGPVRLAAGLGGGWAAGALVGLAQAGPRRLRQALRGSGGASVTLESV